MSQNSMQIQLSSMCQNYMSSYIKIKEKIQDNILDLKHDEDLDYVARFIKAYEGAPPKERRLINAMLFDRSDQNMAVEVNKMKFLKDFNSYKHEN